MLSRAPSLIYEVDICQQENILGSHIKKKIARDIFQQEIENMDAVFSRVVNFFSLLSPCLLVAMVQDKSTFSMLHDLKSILTLPPSPCLLEIKGTPVSHT